MVEPGEVISYRQMCDLEEVNTLQRGMNYRLRPGHSVVLMSRRDNAPYEDAVMDDGRTLVYEGHDEPKTKGCPNPKVVDQPLAYPSGKPTQNGKFWEAAKARGAGHHAEPVRVYEKLLAGIWVYNGLFALRDADRQESGGRLVCKFRLELFEDQEPIGVGVVHANGDSELQHTRLIPSDVKQVVWRRDGGKCVQCGSADNLHFDHVVPFSRGGSSLLATNIQLLCARHNLQKSDKIQ